MLNATFYQKWISHIYHRFLATLSETQAQNAICCKMRAGVTSAGLMVMTFKFRTKVRATNNNE